MNHAQKSVSWHRRFGLVSVSAVAATALLAGGYAAAGPGGDKCHDGHGKSDQSANCTGNKGDDGDDENGGGGNPLQLPDPQNVIDTVTGLVPAPPSDIPDPTTLIPAPPSDIPDPTTLIPAPPSDLPDPTTLLPSETPDPTTLLPSPPSVDPQQVVDTVTSLLPSPPA